MNKYKFANGYVAEWPNKAINPEGINMNESHWSPEVPDVHKLGDQFVGEYLYAFIPKMMQPAVNRTQKRMMYVFDTNMEVCVYIDFKPNKSPEYSPFVLPVNNQNED